MSSLFRKVRVVFILFFMLGNSLAWAAQDSDALSEWKVIKEFDVELISNLNRQKLLVLDGGDSSGRILALVAEKDGKQSIISKAPFALPNIKNDYSPASFDGFDVSVVHGAEKLVSITGVQGEDTLYNYAPSKSGDIVNLATKEDGNAESNFNIQFQYDALLKKVVVAKVLLVNSNSECDRSVMSVYALPLNKLMSVPFEQFDGAKAFEYLKKLRLDVNTAQINSEKLFSVSVISNFEKALAAFKVGDKEKLKELVGAMLAEGGSSDSCAPDSYIVEKYYYPRMAGWSNDVGFLFSEAGYYAEAIELLKMVVSGAPDRAVAYLNLADAYWGASFKELSAENYKKYSALMQQSGRSTKIPKRVGERS